MSKLDNVFQVFANTYGEIKPHFFLTGPSGTGKTLTINSLCHKHKMVMLTINAAALTKEGTSGNSLSKALSPLRTMEANTLKIVFVDEFDKLFIAGNSNDDKAHESTVGVQNEFLKVLEGQEASVFGDYGKYTNVSVEKCLFVFAGAFNGEKNVTIQRLGQLGIKTEFLGRVNLSFSTEELLLSDLEVILEQSELLDKYLKLFRKDKDKVLPSLKDKLHQQYEENTIGARVIDSIIHTYFIADNNKESKKEKEYLPLDWQ